MRGGCVDAIRFIIFYNFNKFRRRIYAEARKRPIGQNDQRGIPR
jgi:hypothetical protein